MSVENTKVIEEYFAMPGDPIEDILIDAFVSSRKESKTLRVNIMGIELVFDPTMGKPEFMDTVGQAFEGHPHLIEAVKAKYISGPAPKSHEAFQDLVAPVCKFLLDMTGRDAIRALSDPVFLEAIGVDASTLPTPNVQQPISPVAYADALAKEFLKTSYGNTHVLVDTVFEYTIKNRDDSFDGFFWKKNQVDKVAAFYAETTSSGFEAFYRRHNISVPVRRSTTPNMHQTSNTSLSYKEAIRASRAAANQLKAPETFREVRSILDQNLPDSIDEAADIMDQYFGQFKALPKCGMWRSMMSNTRHINREKFLDDLTRLMQNTGGAGIQTRITDFFLFLPR